MIHFRLSVLGRDLLTLDLGETRSDEPAPPVPVVVQLDTPTTERDGCFFAQTAEDVAWDEALDEGCDGDCEERCEHFANEDDE